MNGVGRARDSWLARAIARLVADSSPALLIRGGFDGAGPASGNTTKGMRANRHEVALRWPRGTDARHRHGRRRHANRLDLDRGRPDVDPHARRPVLERRGGVADPPP